MIKRKVISRKPIASIVETFSSLGWTNPMDLILAKSFYRVPLNSQSKTLNIGPGTSEKEGIGPLLKGSDLTILQPEKYQDVPQNKELLGWYKTTLHLLGQSNLLNKISMIRP